MSGPSGPDKAPGRDAVPGRVALNGQTPVAGISPYDRGLHFGDGLFETLVCRQGRVRFLSLHLQRLAQSCERLRINLGDVGPLRRELNAVAAAATDVLIKVIVTRGDADARGYAWSGTEVATRVVFQYPLPAENAASARDGIDVRVAQTRYGENERLAGMKHLNRLEQVLARSEVPTEDAAELLVFSSSGFLVSGTMSNVFLVQNGRLRTPRVDRCGVAGIMRRVVLREAAALGIVAEEAALTAADVEGAAEMFVTNARIGIWPVRSLDARTFAIGAVTRRLQARLAPMLENPVDA
jgi:4-amino-4-deoxychorismate lyase